MEKVATVGRRRARRFLALAAALLALTAAAEWAARGQGLHRPLLYEATGYGYRVRPDQAIVRFGNRVSYDIRGLRSEPVAPTPPPGTLRVLCIGDSITNGGTLTDQADTYPEQLARRLAAAGTRAEVLNASAGGWALGNAAGWLDAEGTQAAHVVVIEVATHDLFQPPAPSTVVGHHPAFPRHAPWLALQEVVLRYAIPRLFPALRAADPGTEGVDATPGRLAENLDILERMVARVLASGALPVVLHVPQPAPLEPSDQATRAARLSLAERTARLGVPLVSVESALAAAGGQALFRDAFHPNPAGNAVLAAEVAVEIAKLAGATAAR